MWNFRIIEQATGRKLKEELGEERGGERFALYLAARKALVEQVVPEIKAILPEHTDHGPEHVASVLDRAGSLLGLESPDGKVPLSGVELYCLILSILFHDVGNVFDRDDHQKKIASVYDYVRSAAENRDKNERLIVFRAVEAHCGKARDGSKDTLSFLGPKELSVSLEGRGVRLHKIAAILRLADELAEGHQRVSGFMQQHFDYKPESALHRKYAGITSVTVDPGGERIALTYQINIGRTSNDMFKIDDGAGFDGIVDEFRSLLEFTYKRIEKLNQERRYARHYCDLLEPFKETTVSFVFWVDGQMHTFDPQNICITDLVVPGEKEKPFTERAPDYAADKVIARLRGLFTPGSGT